MTQTNQAEPTKPLEMTGWLVEWDNGDSWKSFEKNAKLIARVCPHWYACGPDGLVAHTPRISKESRERAVKIAHQNGSKVLALTNNFGEGDFDPARVSKFLNDPKLMDRHAKTLVSLAKADGADGVDLDYEMLWDKDRDAFSRFVEAVALECHKKGLLVAIAVHPKTEEPGDWECSKAQDWKRLGAVVDFFRPMCYDYHNSIANAGPIAPPDWTERILNLAVSLVPPSKIEMGLPVYGYDWKGKTSLSYTWSEFEKAAKDHGPARRDAASGELTFKYDDREVWFVDTQALLPKYEMAKKRGLRGLAVWRLGGEDPEFWNTFKKER